MKTKITRPERPFRYFSDDIEYIVQAYGSRARVVQLWRLADGTSDRWIYLARITRYQCTIEYIANRVRGGEYPAKNPCGWDPQRRRSPNFERVAFPDGGRVTVTCT